MIEHGFSAMKNIKSDWRNRLNEETLDNLMIISIEGPPVSGFDPQVAVEFFCCKTEMTRYSAIWTKAQL